MYYPDRWVMVKIAPKEHNEYYRVFGTWLGGYARGDEWRLNSGVTKCNEDGDELTFSGYSGSTYVCNKNSYGTSAYTESVLQRLIATADGVVSILPEDTNWTELNYEI